ncbi:tuberoinfundibular peptide of 39 residues [Kryptolebias marmoratus]|uniref:tuberoinfundibular peptide of 39 residues n=1 Tax=Kryptolebias marmoratus TaxID=37003 RepID=UPI0007F8FC4C|nr:tuberoinfundibular peptide of 39 residues [Kryptolebias marmoratus]XP_024866009.1 tuberoinfundibular peptide of 39 residues [Kryptolebias marmoratus]
MSEFPARLRSSLLLLCILGMTSVTSGFPQARLRLRSPDDPEEVKRDDWDVLFPSISLHDWDIQMMAAAPGLRAAADAKTGLMREAWLFGPERTAASVEGVWPADWASDGARLLKRNMVVADDAAFREKSKLLTSMERQKWLNSYMQKLLVVNS